MPRASSPKSFKSINESQHEDDDNSSKEGYSSAAKAVNVNSIVEVQDVDKNTDGINKESINKRVSFSSQIDVAPNSSIHNPELLKNAQTKKHHPTFNEETLQRNKAKLETIHPVEQVIVESMD